MKIKAKDLLLTKAGLENMAKVCDNSGFPNRIQELDITLSQSRQLWTTTGHLSVKVLSRDHQVYGMANT